MFDSLMTEMDNFMLEFDRSVSNIKEPSLQSMIDRQAREVSKIPFDISVSKTHIYMAIALPGFEKKNISVDVKNDILIVQATPSFEAKSGHEQLIERTSRIFKDQAKLEWKINPDVHDVEHIYSSMWNGIVYIKIPFIPIKEKQKSIDRKIEIQ